MISYINAQWKIYIIKMKVGKNVEVAPFINTTILENEIGTRTLSYLTNITTGIFTGASLIFHTEESGLCFEYTKNRVNSVCYEIDTVGKYDFNDAHGFESDDEHAVNYERIWQTNLECLASL